MLGSSTHAGAKRPGLIVCADFQEMVEIGFAQREDTDAVTAIDEKVCHVSLLLILCNVLTLWPMQSTAQAQTQVRTVTQLRPQQVSATLNNGSETVANSKSNHGNVGPYDHVREADFSSARWLVAC